MLVRVGGGRTKAAGIAPPRGAAMRGGVTRRGFRRGRMRVQTTNERRTEQPPVVEDVVVEAPAVADQLAEIDENAGVVIEGLREIREPPEQGRDEAERDEKPEADRSGEGVVLARRGRHLLIIGHSPFCLHWWID